MTVCVTGATGFLGAHVVNLLAESGERPRVTYRDEARLSRLGEADVDPVRADVLDRAALRRAMKGCELVYHMAGVVASRPVARVWEINALAPRLAVEAAAAEGVGRVVVTSSVAGIGPVREGELGREDDVYRGGGLGLTYVDSKHEGEAEAVAAGARHGIEVVVVNPSYVLGPPIEPSTPPESSCRTVVGYLRGRLPAVVDAETDFVDVRDVARGHLRAAERGRPGERYVLGGHRLAWVDLIERVAELSGVRRPLALIPRELGGLARRAEALGVPSPLPTEGIVLMAQNWAYSSAKARRELGYRPRPLDRTLRDTVAWAQEWLAESGRPAAPSPMSLMAAGLRLADRAGVLRAAHAAERVTGRRLLVGG